MQRRSRSKHFARCTFALDVYHLESSSLQLRNRSTLGLQQKLYKARLFNLKLYVIKPFIISSTYHRIYSCFSKRKLNHAQHRALLCWNHVTYCLFEWAARAKKEFLLRLKILIFLQELSPLVSSRVLCRVSSKDKKLNFEAKKSPRRIRFVCTIVYYGATLCSCFCFYFYKPLM